MGLVNLRTKSARVAAVCAFTFIFLFATASTRTLARTFEPTDETPQRAFDKYVLSSERESLYLGMDGEGKPRFGTLDGERDVQYYEKKALDENDAVAMAGIGLSYIVGIEGHADCGKGVEWLVRSAKLGSAEAKLRLSKLFSEGTCVPLDHKKSVNYLREAVADKTASDVIVGEAAFDLAIDYSEGIGVPKDKREEFLLYELAAAKGNTKAMCNLGLGYAYGEDYVKVDGAKAVEYFQKAINAGDPLGKLGLAECYYNGVGVSSSPGEAFRLADEAEKDFIAMARMGIIDRDDKETRQALVTCWTIKQNAASASFKEFNSRRSDSDPDSLGCCWQALAIIFAFLVAAMYRAANVEKKS